MGANDDMDPLLKPQTPMHEQERTPEFTEATAPKGLQHNHRVKAGGLGEAHRIGGGVALLPGRRKRTPLGSPSR